MATTAQLTVEKYLNTPYGEYEPEFVNGEIIERSMPTPFHGWLTHLLSMRLHTAGYCLIASRMRPGKNVIRIPDLSVFHQFPSERVPASPPFVTVEIVSPDDRHEDLIRKLEEYRLWGVEHVWLVEPELRKFHVYDSRGLMEVRAFELPGLRIDAAELFAEALK
jgi:Uma2 family endonuclease